jgi:hypothetical protein
VLFVPLVGNTDTPVQSPDTDLALALKGVVPRVGYTEPWVNCT